MDSVLQLVGTIGGWGLAIVLGFLALMPKKGSLENLRIDQLQEDLAEERKRREALDGRIDILDAKLDTYRKRDIAWMRYVAVLQRGVEAGDVPPWPDLPVILRGGE